MERIYSDEPLGVLSGGEKIKVQLIRLLVDEPTILLLDEPSNDLDIETLVWLEEFIRSSDIPVLYISHDETLLERTANMIVHIEQLRRKTAPRYTVVHTSYPDYISRRSMQFEKQEQLAKSERREFAKQQEKFRQIQQKVAHQQNTISRQDPHGGRLLKKTMHRVKAYEARFEKEFESMTERPEYEEAMFTKFGGNVSVPGGRSCWILRLTSCAFRRGMRHLPVMCALWCRGRSISVLQGETDVERQPSCAFWRRSCCGGPM